MMVQKAGFVQFLVVVFSSVSCQIICGLGPDPFTAVLFLMVLLRNYINIGLINQNLIKWQHPKRKYLFLCFISPCSDLQSTIFLTNIYMKLGKISHTWCLCYVFGLYVSNQQQCFLLFTYSHTYLYHQYHVSFQCVHFERQKDAIIAVVF